MKSLFLLALLATESLLPEAPEKALVVAQCTGCHSEKLILQNRMTRENWDRTITWMQQTQNLWQLPADVRERILDYLARELAPRPDDDPVRMRRRVNPLPRA